MANLNIKWKTPDEFRSLHPAEAHLWAADLNCVPDRLAKFRTTLTDDELARAERFRFEQHRNRFIAGRGILRSILGQYLKVEPGSIRFEYAEKGKPMVANSGLHFNLAHSDDLALVAVTTISSIGIDVEKTRPVTDADEIVQRFFSERETQLYNSLPSELKSEAFFNLWTRKEAWLKCTGQGITHSLREVEVSLHPDEPAKILSIPSEHGKPNEWTLRDLVPSEGFKAAIALPATKIEIRCWQWRV